MSKPVYHANVAQHRELELFARIREQTGEMIARAFDDLAPGLGDTMREAETPPMESELKTVAFSMWIGTEPTEQEIAEHDAWEVEAAAQRELQAAEMVPHVRAYLALDDPVAELHTPDEYGECQGDDFSGYEGEPPEWPCHTAIVVAHAHDIALYDVPVDWRDVIKRAREDA